MNINCTDVCSDLVDRLGALGYDLGDDDDHLPILEALADVKMERPVPTEATSDDDTR